MKKIQNIFDAGLAGKNFDPITCICLIVNFSLVRFFISFFQKVVRIAEFFHSPRISSMRMSQFIIVTGGSSAG